MLGVTHHTDLRTGAVDRIPLTDPADWNARLHVRQEMPRDRLFWIVTEEPEAVEVAYDADATYWLPAEHAPYFTRRDGEAGCYGADEIAGWTDDQEDAEEAAELLKAAA